MRALRAHGPRVLISLYFFNNLAQGLQLWRSNNGAFPLVAAVVALPAAALAANAHARFAAAVCCAELAHASAAVVLDVGGTRWRSGVWFVDELMVKKFSLLGGGLMLLLQLHFGPGASGTRRANSSNPRHFDHKRKTLELIVSWWLSNDECSLPCAARFSLTRSFRSSTMVRSFAISAS